ncbi:MAG: hypothetical protein ACP5HM_04525 [Anaerolineae bacterium]
MTVERDALMNPDTDEFQEGTSMETKVIRIEIKFTRMTVAVLLGAVLLGAVLLGGSAVAQAPRQGIESPESMDGKGTVIMTTEVVSSAISYQGGLGRE